MFVEKKNSTLWVLVRTTYGIGQSFSKDGGKSWSPGAPSSIPHVNSRFFIRRLPSGNLVLVRHNPPPENAKARSHLTAFLSDDDGATWKGGLLLDDRSGVSYPDGTIAPDGTIFVTYDYQRSGEKIIYEASFTEADILAGKWTSPQAHERLIINQAHGAPIGKKTAPPKP